MSKTIVFGRWFRVMSTVRHLLFAIVYFAGKNSAVHVHKNMGTGSVPSSGVIRQ